MSYAHILGTMYEHSSYYDKGFIIDELMLYHIIYDLYHDPYFVSMRIADRLPQQAIASGSRLTAFS